eukprot:TRINITY_DN44098_c1_g1_i1.p1 TRINITY_DN44098_c1_g1~~TRINITY_DN44098_c1_g1_i1.p1  ORF type:complete len:218 (-),score=72.96 TRINITY_DN44098_c1_g1_i1:220-873(-)
MSKIPQEQLEKVVQDIYTYSLEERKRGFVETIELQIGLKNYDPARDKRFNGSIKLDNPCKPGLKFCVLGDAVHQEQAEQLGIDCLDINALKQFKRDKKLVKKLAAKYDAFLASETIIRQVPRLLGPGLNKAGKFPTLITHNDSIEAKMLERQCTVKFQMRKVLCLGVAIANVGLTQEETLNNIQKGINFFVSLLKKHWQNVRCLYLKSTMGPPHRIY